MGNNANEPGIQAANTVANEPAPAAATPPAAPEKTYTQAELDAAIQREADRRVAPVANQLTQVRESLKALEQQRVEQMTAAERQKWELEQQAKAIAAEKEALAVEKRQRMALEEIAKRSWPKEAAQAIEADSPEGVAARADVIDKIARAIADVTVHARLAATGGVPNSVGATTDTGVLITKEQLATMSSEAIAKAYAEGKLKHLTG